MPQLEAEPLEQRPYAQVEPRGEMAREHGVARVERKSDRHRLTMPDLVVRQGFELVRGPMAEIERTHAATLERIAAMRDLAHMQDRAMPDEPVERLRREDRERFGLGLQP